MAALIYSAAQQGPLPVRDKAPGEVVSYELDWAVELAAGELITTSVWSLDAGITQESAGIAAGQTKVTIVVSGGTPETTYRLTNHVTTNQGLEFEKDLRQLVRI